MIKPAVPFFIGEKAYYLRFEIQDMMFLEDNFGTLLEMFNPKVFGFKTAAKFLLVSCYDKDGEDYAHHFGQHQKSLEPAMEMVRDFCNQFEGPLQGSALLYSSVHSALVASGWFRAPGDANETSKVADIKNVKSPKSSSKPRKAKPSVSVG